MDHNTVFFLLIIIDERVLITIITIKQSGFSLYSIKLYINFILIIAYEASHALVVIFPNFLYFVYIRHKVELNQIRHPSTSNTI